MRLLYWLKYWFLTMPTVTPEEARRAALDNAKRELIEAQHAADYYTAMCVVHQQRIERYSKPEVEPLTVGSFMQATERAYTREPVKAHNPVTRNTDGSVSPLGWLDVKQHSEDRHSTM